MNNKQVHAAVDRLLLEQGEYSPLEYLLQEGRLQYSDYEAWRGGEIEYLEQALFGDSEQIHNQLCDAEKYANSLGLQVESLRYNKWQSSAPQALKFSSDNADLERCFQQRFHHKQDTPQMDLFYDAVGNSHYNGIINALSDRDYGEAQRLLECLYDAEPGHARIGDLESMMGAVSRLDLPVDDAELELQWLQNQLFPLVESLFGNTSRHILVPFWRRLTLALGPVTYDSEQPQLHASFTAMQSMEWESARNAIETEPNWQADKILLRRHVQVCGQLQQHTAALLSWFRLCWRFPESTGDTDRFTNADFLKNWLAFLDLDPELSPGSFPAWLLLVKPGLVNVLQQPESVAAYPSDAHTFVESYCVIYRLQSNKIKNSSTDNNGMKLRAKLNSLDDALYAHFLHYCDERS